jgi:drug/metabolite transporter (DMT)-like permease
VAGLIAAFLGVVLILSDKLSLPSPSALVGDVLCLLAGVAWGATTLVIRTTKLSETSPEKVLLYQLAVSAVLLIAVAPLFGPLVRDLTVPVAGVFLFQVVVVAAASFLTWFWLLRRYPASQLSAFTFLTPVFGVALGGFLLSEPLSVKLVAALALVAAGIALVSRKTQ